MDFNEGIDDDKNPMKQKINLINLFLEFQIYQKNYTSIGIIIHLKRKFAEIIFHADALIEKYALHY